MFLVIVLVICTLGVINAAGFKDKLTEAVKATDAILDRIQTRWDISNFPNFLRSASMSHTSWEVLKVRLF